MTPSVCVIVASHKSYRMPEHEMYLPLHVGAKGKPDIGYTRDDTGDNISELNPYFCELTGLYWAWKNLGADYIGLSHYRRHFVARKEKDPFDGVLSYDDLKPYLGRVRLFVPRKRRYYIETLYSHYKHTHYSVHLDETRNIIKDKYPDYLNSYDRVLRHTYGYMFNMMIAERDLLNDYCSWLFDILFELKKRTGMPELSAYQGRFYGRVSEIIFNVWLDHMLQAGAVDRSEIREIPCAHMEKINWFRKGTAFLRAKFLHKRYDGSF